MKPAYTRYDVERAKEVSGNYEPPSLEERARNYQDWAKAAGLRASRSELCVSRLFGKHCRRWDYRGRGYDEVHEHPYQDHARMWSRQGKTTCLTSDIYGMTPEKEAKLIAFAHAHGLGVAINASPSPYWPGVTTLVELWRPGSLGVEGA